MTTQKKEVEIRKCDWCDKEVSNIEKSDAFIGWYTVSQTVGTYVEYKERFVNTKRKDFCCLKCLREQVSCISEVK